MRKLLGLIVIVLILSACENKDTIPICGNLNEEESNWIQNQIENIKQNGDRYSYVVQAKYNGELVYSFQGCDPAALYAIIYFRCNGEQISNAELDEFTNQQIIWRPDNSVCNFD